MRDIKGLFMITTQSYHAGKNNDEPLATGRPGHVTFLIPPVISRVYSEKKKLLERPSSMYHFYLICKH